MGWALDSVVAELATELQQNGIEVKLESRIMLTRGIAVRLPRSRTTEQYRKLFRDEIEHVKQIKAEQAQARQVSLL